MKKGELSSAVVIPLILIIAAFLIILAFLVRNLYFSELITDETCKLSVITRATAPKSVQHTVPLKCQTKKICLTSGKGKCEEAFAGEKAQFIKIPDIRNPKNDNPEKIREAAVMIEEASAQAMYDCWNIMGQGKVDLFHNLYTVSGAASGKVACVICSRVAIDKGVNKNVLDNIDINEYMRTHQVPGSSLTYLQAFTDKSVNSYSKVDSGFTYEKYNEEIDKILGDDNNVESETDRLSKVKFEEWSSSCEEKIDGKCVNRQMVFVFSQIKTESIKDYLSRASEVGLTLGVTSFVTPVVRNIATKIIFHPTGAVVSLVAGSAAVGYGVYNVRQGQLAAIGHCGQFTSGDKDAQYGCSLVQGVNYNINDIDALCPIIQGGN